MKIGAAAILLAAIGLAGCSPMKKRWTIPEGTIVFKPICAAYRAPSLGEAVPGDGVVPALLFSVDGASAEETAKLRRDLQANGFAVGEGTVTINGTNILFAAGQGVLKTQSMADRLFQAMCQLEQSNIRLVHVRYNSSTEANRMI